MKSVKVNVESLQVLEQYPGFDHECANHHKHTPIDLTTLPCLLLPVVPHKAVAEVSKLGNL